LRKYSFILFAGFTFIATREKDPRVIAKKKLAITNRVKRILFIAFPIIALIGLVALISGAVPLWLLAIHVIPFTLM